MTLLLRFWPHLLIGAAILGAGVWVNRLGYESGYNASEAKWKPAFDAANTARVVAEARTDTREAQSKLITARREAEHAALVSSLTLRADAADGRIRSLMRKHSVNTCSGSLPAVPGTAPEPAAASASIELAERVGGDLVALARRCEEDAAALTSLQKWTREQQQLLR